jgi:hypothetical protein
VGGKAAKILSLAAFVVTSVYAVESPLPTTAPFSPHIQDPQELALALRSTDTVQALHLLWSFGCSPQNADSIEVVQRAWDTRESVAANAATRDPVVRALMAKCLVEHWSGYRSGRPEDASIEMW